MNNAFIFDLDGVLIANEHLWEAAKKEIFNELFGESVTAQMGSTVGLNMDAIYDKAEKLGVTVGRQKLFDKFFEQAIHIYSTAPLTQGIQELGAFLVQKNFAIGIVSASPKAWMDLVIDRLAFKSHIKLIISLDQRKDLAHKPEPDGYLEAIKKLGSSPRHTLILEDSNAGIQSAKKSGAYTIGLKQNLVAGYVQKGADVYVENVGEIKKIILESWLGKVGGG